VLPADDARAFEERATATYIAPPFVTQATIAEFVARGHFELNLERVCGELRSRRDAMLGALERTFPADSTWSRPEGGYFVWLDLGDAGDASELARRAETEGVAFVPGADFFPDGSEAGRSSARLAFSFETPDRIVEGIERIAALLG